MSLGRFGTPFRSVYASSRPPLLLRSLLQDGIPPENIDDGHGGGGTLDSDRWADQCRPGVPRYVQQMRELVLGDWAMIPPHGDSPPVGVVVFRLQCVAG